MHTLCSVQGEVLWSLARESMERSRTLASLVANSSLLGEIVNFKLIIWVLYIPWYEIFPFYVSYRSKGRELHSNNLAHFQYFGVFIYTHYSWHRTWPDIITSTSTIIGAAFYPFILQKFCDCSIEFLRNIDIARTSSVGIVNLNSSERIRE